MKKIYLIVFIISLFQLHSQSWCTPGSTWHYSVVSPSTGYTKYTYLYDTLVGTNLCNKIKYEAHGTGMGGPFNIYNYIYTYEQNGIVFKNNGTLNTPVYDTLYNFTGAVGTKWRCQLSGLGGGSSCANSYIEITDVGTIVVQGQTLNWRKIFYKNYYFYGQTQQWIESGTDTIFERIGTRHNMEFITGSYCADATDVGPLPFRCFSDNQINFQSSSVACDFTTRVDEFNKKGLSLEVNNPASSFIFIKIKSQTNKDSKHIVLIDQVGNKVIDTYSNENEISLNINDIAHGIYVLQLYVGDDLLSKKLIIHN